MQLRTTRFSPVDEINKFVTSQVVAEPRRPELRREHRTLAVRTVVLVQLDLPEPVQRRLYRSIQCLEAPECRYPRVFR